MNDPSERPQLAITLGDVAGVGPEVVVKALADPAVRRCCRPIVIGRESVLRRTAALCDLPLDADGQEVIDSGDVGSLDGRSDRATVGTDRKRGLPVAAARN